MTHVLLNLKDTGSFLHQRACATLYVKCGIRHSLPEPDMSNSAKKRTASHDVSRCFTSLIPRGKKKRRCSDFVRHPHPTSDDPACRKEETVCDTAQRICVCSFVSACSRCVSRAVPLAASLQTSSLRILSVILRRTTPPLNTPGFTVHVFIECSSFGSLRCHT